MLYAVVNLHSDPGLKAELLYMRALAIWEKAFHPDVATSLNNLAQPLKGAAHETDSIPLTECIPCPDPSKTLVGHLSQAVMSFEDAA